MTSRIISVICFIAAVSVAMVAQTEPVLTAANMPKYTPLARQARVEGTVKLTFTLAANTGEPMNIEVVSGHPMLKGAAMENLKTWKFENANNFERKYETTFRYRVSGLEVPNPQRCVVTFDSYHQVDIVTDVAQPTVSY